MKNNIGLLLFNRAKLNPDREVYVDGQSGERLSFAQLNTRCNRIANALVNIGVKPGDRVAIALMNSAEFLEVYFAVAKIGGIIAPLNWRLVTDELGFILKDSGAGTLIFGEEFIDIMAELHGRGDKTDVVNWIQIAESNGNSNFSWDYAEFRDAGADHEPEIGAADDDPLFIMYTSGTTGLPKGAVHSHGTFMWGLLTVTASSDLRDADRFLITLPLFHIGSLTPVTLNVYRGVTSVIMKEFNPVRVWELIEKEKITNTMLVPSMLNFMLQVPDVSQYDFSSLRWVQSGASPLPVSLIQKYVDLDIDILQTYGLTEGSGPACMISADKTISKIGSVGRASFHAEVRVVDENGKDCPPGEQGEVWVKGGHVMLGYWNRPDATGETITEDGWLRTGDVALVDEEGFIYIQDRIKDMIISGGENVYPAEIENVILTHAGVSEVAVIGQPSDKWGESPFALVVRTDESVKEADILTHCQGKLARFKLPKGVAFIDVLPRNANGKVLKRELRMRFPGPASE